MRPLPPPPSLAENQNLCLHQKHPTSDIRHRPTETSTSSRYLQLKSAAKTSTLSIFHLYVSASNLLLHPPTDYERPMMPQPPPPSSARRICCLHLSICSNKEQNKPPLKISTRNMQLPPPPADSGRQLQPKPPPQVFSIFHLRQPLPVILCLPPPTDFGRPLKPPPPS